LQCHLHLQDVSMAVTHADDVRGNPVGASKPFKGSGATMSAGVLTFTLDDPASPDNGKTVSFKVMRMVVPLPLPPTVHTIGQSHV
jgi:hypothetical protein